jgi:hypothetical protein
VKQDHSRILNRKTAKPRRRIQKHLNESNCLDRTHQKVQNVDQTVRDNVKTWKVQKERKIVKTTVNLDPEKVTVKTQTVPRESPRSSFKKSSKK